MTTLRTLITLSIACSLSSAAAFAQTDRTETADQTRTADRTGTGGGPLSTEKAPNTSAVGQTKPPGRDAGPTSGTPIERRTPRRAAVDAIDTMVCTGCGPAPRTTDVLTTGTIPTGEPRERDAQLNELRDEPKPAPQPDLDTFALASAHREQAKSVEEKTNGLWQSWLLSVCEGCGDQRPAKALTLDEWPNRNEPTATGSLGQKPAPGGAPVARTSTAGVHHGGSLESDLSPENVDAIRRMPRR